MVHVPETLSICVVPLQTSELRLVFPSVGLPLSPVPLVQVKYGNEKFFLTFLSGLV